MLASHTQLSRAARLAAIATSRCLIVAAMLCAQLTSAEEPPTARSVVLRADHLDLHAEVADLSAPSYAVRMAAMQALIEAGPSAVDLIVEQLGHTEDAELQLRALEVLERLARREIATRDSAAVQALEILGASDNQVLAGRARSRLNRVSELRRQFARQRLQTLGAKFDAPTWRLQPFPGRPGIHDVTLNSQSWLGTSEDAHLLTELRHVGRVKLAGKQITDDYIEPVAQLELVELSLNRTRITDAGMAALITCRDLAILEVQYTDITDLAVKALSQMNLHSIKIIGTQMTLEGIEALRESIPGATIEFKAGAYLGVSAELITDGEEGCRLNEVKEGSAAAKAGLMVDDIITLYDGKEVHGFESLRDLIAQDRPGEIVVIEWLRRGKKFKREVELGEWD